MHIPVLLKETTEALEPKNGDTILDCTVNNGGHSRVLAEKIGDAGLIVGLDEDKNALIRAEENLTGLGPKVILEESNFRDLDKVLDKHGIKTVDRIIFDLGLSSDQLELSGRGFSFQKDEPLLMTFGVVPKIGQLTALEIVNSWSAEDLAGIFREYGEERLSERFAEAIVSARKSGVIKTTSELREIIFQASPAWYRRGRIHPATRTFQALRIAVNDELGAIREALPKACRALKDRGRLAVITFHSLEDRIVKQFFKEIVSSGDFRAVNKKPVTAGRSEIKENPRSRSAKLRIVEKIK